jgi:rare lipoprotein A (peptidoglycan hydrolase)
MAGWVLACFVITAGIVLFGHHPQPIPAPNHSVAVTEMVDSMPTAVVSWYGASWDGRTQANGKPFDHRKLTYASRTDKFGTLRVFEHPVTKRYVLAVCTDRGPAIPCRDYDISEAAACSVGIKATGVATLNVYRIR